MKILQILFILSCFHSVFGLFSPEYSLNSDILPLNDHQRSKRDILETLRDFGSSSGVADESKLTVSRRIYNSSIALTIPFFSFKIPHLSDGGFLVNQAIFGVFAWTITGLPFFMSFIFTGTTPTSAQSRSFQRLSTTAKSSSFNFLGPDFYKSFGMDGSQCIQKVLCQAHSPKGARKYGLISSAIRTVFPLYENATIEDSPLQSAARAGKLKENCDNLYDCILDPLGSARYLIHWYGHNNENARFLMKMVDFDSDYSSTNVRIS